MSKILTIIRGGRRVVTVEIFNELYTKVRAEANKRNMTAKHIINQRLDDSYEKDDFLSKLYPHLSIDSYSEDKVTIKDTKLKVLIDLEYRNEGLYCEVDKGPCCIHVKYVLMSPKVARRLSTTPQATKSNNKNNSMLMAAR